MASKVCWLSGASSGLGRAAARALKAQGWQVVAGARSFKDSQGDSEEGYRLGLDVCQQASVDAFVEEALRLYGPPDALINAAGILIMGPAETTSLKEYDLVMDTVFYGSVRLTQAVLPHMRKQGHGKIAMLSSVNGLMPTPYQSAYVSAKHALEGYSECLMLETAPQGIQVMLVEPGDHRGGDKRYRNPAQEVSPVYEASFQRVRDTIFQDEAQGGHPERFGHKLALVLGRKRLPARLKVTTLKENAAIVLHDVLPGRLFTRFLANYYKV